jgi:hypothetical protein
MNAAVRGGTLLYYFKYYVGDDGTPIFLIFDKTAIFMSLGLIAMIIGIALTKTLSERFEKRSLLMILTVLNSASMALFYVIPPDQYWMMVAVNCLGSLLNRPGFFHPAIRPENGSGSRCRTGRYSLVGVWVHCKRSSNGHFISRNSLHVQHLTCTSFPHGCSRHFLLPNKFRDNQGSRAKPVRTAQCCSQVARGIGRILTMDIDVKRSPISRRV